MEQSLLLPIRQPSDLPDTYVVFTGGLTADQVMTSRVPLRVVEVRPTTNAAGEPGHVVACESWRGDIVDYAFSKLKQHAAIVNGLYEWFERIDKDRADEYERLLQIRGEIARKELEHLHQMELQDVQPEWMEYARKALRRVFVQEEVAGDVDGRGPPV